jgi:NitT/TauT family transport system permease protein
MNRTLAPTTAMRTPTRARKPGPARWQGAGPWLFGVFLLGLWEACVRIGEVPPYVLPGPWAIAQAMVSEFGLLWPSLLVTLKVTLLAFTASALSGLVLALVFTLSKPVERTLLPYAVVLQVTPVVAIAPLIIIWVSDVNTALLVCAWLVAFFPVLSNTIVGLNSADRNLRQLFALYDANGWQQVMWLKLPSAMPYYLAGLRISGGLALIGAVVAEFVAGTAGTQSGLAYQILEAGYRLQIPRMFAALVLISATGIAIYLALSLLTRLVLRHWHDSEAVGA